MVVSPPDDSVIISKSVVNILNRVRSVDIYDITLNLFLISPYFFASTVLQIASDIEMTYAIQSDADEFTTYNALKHFKYCQMKNKTQEVYFPSIVFKKNFYWVEKTKDLVVIFFKID